MALLFAADRVDHIEAEVVPNLMDGVTVITDRYDFSSVAYQSLTSDGGESTIEWVKTINALARRPDLTIVLDVPHEIAATRRKQRARARELYEDDELQARLASFYGDIEKHFPNDKIVHVDGALPLEEVASAIFAAVAERRGERG
jgi:dTMP kinase